MTWVKQREQGIEYIDPSLSAEVAVETGAVVVVAFECVVAVVVLKRGLEVSGEDLLRWTTRIQPQYVQLITKRVMPIQVIVKGDNNSKKSGFGLESK